MSICRYTYAPGPPYHVIPWVGRIPSYLYHARPSFEVSICSVFFTIGLKDSDVIWILNIGIAFISAMSRFPGGPPKRDDLWPASLGESP